MAVNGSRWQPPDLAEIALALGRFGWIVKGVVYAVFGLLALGLVVAIGEPDATGGASSDASVDQAGALEAIADRPFGAVLLAVVAVGLVIYSCWRWYTTFSSELDADVWHRLGYGFSAAWYLLLAWGAAGTIFGGDGSDRDLVVELSADLLGSPGGSIVVAAAGAIAVVAGVVFAVRAVRSDDAGDHDHDAIEPWPDWAEVLAEWMGRIGWGGRAVLTAAVGIVAIVAAVDADIESADGFDGALRDFAVAPFGNAFVGLLGASLVVYGAYCILTAGVRTPSD